MTYYSLLKKGTALLHDAGIEDAGTDAWYLMEAVMTLDRTSYLLKKSEEVPAGLAETYLERINERARRIPLQHILGVQEFMGFSFRVSKDVLIPRQETELLVEEALRQARQILQSRQTEPEQRTGLIQGIEPLQRTGLIQGKEPLQGTDPVHGANPRLGTGPVRGMYRVLDLCTGSGCIAVSMDLLLRKEIHSLKESGDFTSWDPAGAGNPEIPESRPGVQICASDISSAALMTARENAGRLGADVAFYESDLFEDIPGKFNMIISNPPYIAAGEIEKLQPEVRCHDPHIALNGGEDGLSFYRRICGEAPGRLLAGGILLLEIGADQAEAVETILTAAGFSGIRILKDLAGRDRIAEARVG